MKRASVLLVLLAAFADSVLAHEVRPGYLELRQRSPETYDVLWKVPARGEDMRLGISVELPADCEKVTEPRASFAENAFTERWSMKRAGGLTGATIHIAGLSATVIDVLVRLSGVTARPKSRASPRHRRRSRSKLRRARCKWLQRTFGSGSSTFSAASTISCTSSRCSFSSKAGGAWWRR
jgi:hypothetical protein